MAWNDNRVWKCGNPENGFPHFHTHINEILTWRGRFIEGTEVTETDTTTVAALENAFPSR